jgi:hypothetical protein
MSYAGTYFPCEHDNYGPNCEKCIVRGQEARGKRDDQGVLHSDNGGGWCVGHVVENRCTVLVQHCPVLNTPEQLRNNLLRDREARIQAATQDVVLARQALRHAEVKLEEILGEPIDPRIA